MKQIFLAVEAELNPYHHIVPQVPPGRALIVPEPLLQTFSQSPSSWHLYNMNAKRLSGDPGF